MLAFYNFSVYNSIDSTDSQSIWCRVPSTGGQQNKLIKIHDAELIRWQ